MVRKISKLTAFLICFLIYLPMLIGDPLKNCLYIIYIYILHPMICKNLPEKRKKKELFSSKDNFSFLLRFKLPKLSEK